MSDTAGRSSTGERRQRRGTVERLTPAAKPASAEGGSVPSPSPESADRSRQTTGSAQRGPQAEVEKAMPSTPALPARLGRWRYYGLALLLVATGAMVRLGLTHLVGPGLPLYIIFYPVVMLAALVGGWGPGLVATLVAAVVADYWLLPPLGFKIQSPIDTVGLVVFVIMGASMSIVAELYRRIRYHLEDLVVLRTTALNQANQYLRERGEQLQAQTAELTAVNATLESRVAARTAQLEQRARQLQTLTLELTQAEERERARIAEILHDDLQQVLAAAKFQVDLLGRRPGNDADTQEIAGQAKDLLADGIAKSRSLSHELSSPALSRRDLGEAFEWLAEQMQRKHGFTVCLEAKDRIEVASEPLRILLYKAAQEMLFNAIKHAGVQEAKLRLRRHGGWIGLSVSDQGRGFDPADPAYALGFGLRSIRERIELLGGRLKIRSAPGKGSTFFVVLPNPEGGGIVSQSDEDA